MNTYRLERTPCKLCLGAGHLNGDTCPRCNGRGYMLKKKINNPYRQRVNKNGDQEEVD